MAVRQYVGARYVPVYDGDWDNTKTYEPLTIVTVPNVGSYTSRQYVPVGVDISDTDYWYLSGLTSGQLLALENRVDNLEAEDITINGRIDTLANKVEKNILIIGNSYVQRGVCDQLKANFDNSYEVTHGGTGFLTYTGHTDDFEDSLDEAIADSSFDNDDITDILFVSAMGDTRAYAEAPSTFASRLRTALAAIQTKIAANFTNVKRVSLTLAEGRSQLYFSDNPWNALFAVHRVFKNESCDYGINYIGWSGFNQLMKAASFESDKYHPTAAGADAIGVWMEGAYYGSAAYKKFHSTANCIWKYIDNTTTVSVACEVTPEQTQLQIRQATWSTTGSVILTAGETMIALTDLTVPPPAPETNILSVDHLTSFNGGNERDLFNYQIQANSNGIAEVYNVRAPQQATSGGFQAGLPSLTCLTYFN